MLRRIIKINEELCNGCGLCAEGCHEGAIAMIDGKATLIRDDYCDGLGDCLPVCPTSAITFEEREAAAYDEAAVKENMKKAGKLPTAEFKGCLGSRTQTMDHSAQNSPDSQADNNSTVQNQLAQWPVQIKLVPINAAYFDNANLLIAADCCAYAYGNFHNQFMKNRVTLIGCPKLDDINYSEKLTEIIKNNNLKSVTVVRMEVPCCGGIEYAVREAMQQSGKCIPWQVVTLSTDGNILDI